MSREAKILIAILVIVVGGMIALFAFGGGGSSSTSQTTDSSKLVRENSHKQGSGSVTMVEFGDYQCPACGAAFPNIQQIQKEYDGKVTFVFRNFPLTTIHKNAMASSSAAEAAGLQGKFWEMHDKLYSTQDTWSESATAADTFVGYAQELGLDVEKFKTDVASQTVKDIIAKDQQDGNDLQIQATPTIYINGQKADDFQVETLRKLIDAQLNKK